MKHPKIYSALFALALGLVGVSACVQLTAREGDIVLRGHDAANYAQLNAALGEHVCIVAAVSVHDTSAYFLLQPYEEDGIINLSPSRVRIRFGGDDGAQPRFQEGQLRRICGRLQDATPWRRCNRDSCRWYELTDAEIG